MKEQRSFDSRIPPRYRTAADLLLLIWAAVSLPTIAFDPHYPRSPGEWFLIETNVENLNTKEVELFVTQPLSARISSLPVVKEVYASSTSELSTLIVELPSLASKRQLRFSLLKACERLHDRMPHGASSPVLYPLPRMLPPVLIGLEPARVSARGRIDIETITDRLRLDPPWAEVRLFGEARTEIRIEIEPALLAATPLGIREVVDSLRDSLFDFSAGGVVERGLYTPIELSGGVRDREDLRNLYVRGTHGAVPISEIAEVEQELVREHAVSAGGRPALLLSLSPRERGGGATLSDLWELVCGLENALFSRYPGWRFTTLYDPYGRLLILGLLALLCPFAVCLASHIDQTRGLYLGSVDSLRQLGRRVRKATRIAALLILFPALFDIPISYALLPIAPAAALSAFRIRGKTIMGAAIVSTTVFLLYSSPSSPLQLSFSGDYRRFFVQSPPVSPQNPRAARPVEEEGGYEGAADSFSRIHGSFPEGTGPWHIPSKALLPVYHPSLQLVCDHLAVAFVAEDRIAETRAALREKGISLFSARPPEEKAGEERPGSPWTTARTDGEIGERCIESVGFLRSDSSTRTPLLAHGELGSMLQAAVEEVDVGTVTPEERGDFEERESNAGEALTVYSSSIPVRLSYGRIRTPEHISSLPIPVSGKAVALQELGTLVFAEEPIFLLSKNGSALSFRLRPLPAMEAEHGR